MSVALERTYTPEDLLAMPDSKIYELDDGHLVERDMSMLSSWVGGALFSLISIYVRENKLGWVWGADLGYVCFPAAPRNCAIRTSRLSARTDCRGACRPTKVFVRSHRTSPSRLSRRTSRPIKSRKRSPNI